MQNNNQNTLLAITLSVAILLGWTWLYEKPRIEKKEIAQQQKIKEEKVVQAAAPISPSAKAPETVVATKSRDESLDANKNLRVRISSDLLHGSILLKRPL